jgi:hypothetical protein
MNKLIDELDKLAEKATPLPWTNYKTWVRKADETLVADNPSNNDGDFIVAFVNNYAALRAMALAGEKLAQAVNEAALIESHGKCRQKVNFALDAYRNASLAKKSTKPKPKLRPQMNGVSLA